MKTPLLVLLALSLAGNAVLAILAMQRPGPAEKAATHQATKIASVRDEKSAGPAPTSVAPSGSGEATGGSFRWPSAQRKEDLPSLVANLRAAGFPPATIRAIVQQTVNTMYADRANSFNGPYWKPYNNNPSPEQFAAQMALNKERQTLVESLLGPDGRPSAMMDPYSRERLYGRLPNDKVDAIETINRDYGMLSAQTANQRNRSGDGADIAKQMEFLREEQRKDIAALLTAEELEQYEMRTSPSASQVRGYLRNVDVTEAEFVALYRLQQEFTRAYPQPTGRATPETAAQREAAQAQMLERARSILPDDRYFEVLKTTDRRYAQTATFTAQYPSVTPAATYQLYQLDRSTQAAVSQLPATLTREQRQAELDRLGADYRARTQQLLGAEAAAKYGFSSVGRIFQQAPPSGAQPAVKLGGG